MTGPDLRAMMQNWPDVMRQATDPWAQTFAADIWKHAGNGRWRPSHKQAQIMRRMIRELDTETDDLNLIE